MAIVVDKKLCVGCGFCNLMCPYLALTVTSDFVSVVDFDNCTDCMICLTCCPVDAIDEE